MSPLNRQPEYHPWLHRVALLMAVATFVLIFMGGLVTSHQAGMSVPDWPNSYGYNMFLFPPSRWVGGILFEHTHRLMGTFVGFCATVFTLMAWGTGRTRTGRWIIFWITLVLQIFNVAGTAAMIRWPAAFHIPPTSQSPANIASQGIVGGLGILICATVAYFCRVPDLRRWVRWLTTVVLVIVCIQGALGGLRVVLVKLNLAIVHACLAQACFCLMTLAVVVTSRWWLTTDDFSRSPHGRWLIRLALICVCAIYAQLVVGAMMRHYQAGLAIPDLPLAYGKILPPMNQTDLDAANHLRAWNLNLDPVTLGQIWLHFGHRIGVVLVTILITLLIGTILLRHRRADLQIPASVLAGLLVIQITLGVLTVYFRKPADVASAHVAVGALVLATTFLIAVRAMRLYSRPIAARAISPIISNRLAVAGSSNEARY